MSDFYIANRKVGLNEPPLVIAEVGINHEGDIDKAFACVDAAAEAGAELVKFQCHITECEMINTDMKPGDISDEKLFNIIKRCELSEDEEKKVKQYTEDKGLIYLSTPFSREAADRLNEMGVPAFKVGSGECNNLPLLKHIAQFGKPVILSTGMNDIESIKRSVTLLRDYNIPVALMHCTSMYPTPYEKVRLGALSHLHEEFPDMVVGLSDHSLNIYTCLASVALDACILEKHFVVSRRWPGPDVPISIEPLELKELVNGSRAVWMAKNGTKDILNEEKPVIDFAYATLVTIQDVNAGDVVSEENVWVKRPGTGEIAASDYEKCIGKTFVNDLKSGIQIKRSDIC